MYQGYTESQTKVEDRVRRIMQGKYGRAKVLLEGNLELLITQQVLAKSKAARLANELRQEIKESVA
jgi:hypothetical protein